MDKWTVVIVLSVHSPSGTCRRRPAVPTLPVAATCRGRMHCRDPLRQQPNSRRVATRVSLREHAWKAHPGPPPSPSQPMMTTSYFLYLSGDLHLTAAATRLSSHSPPTPSRWIAHPHAPSISLARVLWTFHASTIIFLPPRHCPFTVGMDPERPCLSTSTGRPRQLDQGHWPSPE